MIQGFRDYSAEACLGRLEVRDARLERGRASALREGRGHGRGDVGLPNDFSAKWPTNSGFYNFGKMPCTNEYIWAVFGCIGTEFCKLIY